MRTYRELPKLSKMDALEKLNTSDRDEQCAILLGLAELEDTKWTQDIYLEYANNSDDWVASAAITGLGHLARIHGNLDKNKVINSLEEISSNRPSLSGKIEDALDDINIFMK